MDIADGYTAWLTTLITFQLYSTSVLLISVNKLKTLACMLAKRKLYTTSDVQGPGLETKVLGRMGPTVQSFSYLLLE